MENENEIGTIEKKMKWKFEVQIFYVTQKRKNNCPCQTEYQTCRCAFRLVSLAYSRP